ncbi:S41 family peptidase [Marinicella sp. S1101]|uniref:S41 family peptidase n=1 Tax=Marinicella marina TaxID=2996016 RepID=UPI002260A9D4|nr:S41 family peptidase [Marinicella marina]MCX7554002.1 S41 family peptidase [Marinicella marina]MDJ1140494.1 S41 family peptidase [Marinicella marina]
MNNNLIITLALLTSTQAFSKTFDCSSNLKWLTETFEKNDAGFQYIIDIKGENSYAAHNKLYTEKASQISGLNECHTLLNDWTEFFRTGHLNVQLIAQNQNTSEPTGASDKEKIEKYKNTEQFKVDKKDFDNYIKKLGNNPGFEGVWFSEPYTIGIVKDDKNPNREYIGFIVKSTSPNWQENQVKLEIFKSNEGKYSMKYFMSDHSVEDFEIVELWGKTYLRAGSGFILLKRVLPEQKIDENIDRYYNLMYAQKPYIEKVSDDTVLLKIPSFNYSNKKIIDSLLANNDDLIKSSKNLIIDVRNNGGGADTSYEKIKPYFYTNPIRKVGVAFLSTELNNQRMVDYMNDPDWSDDDKKWAKESLHKLNKHIGEFVDLKESIVNIDTLKNVYPNPKNVAILINNYSGSTTEQFLLEAKQSTKVKLFGTTTAGVLDISNMYHVESPSKEFKLWYGLSKSHRIPEMTIDGKGIQPDYYFDKTIKPYEWIDKTIEILNHK